MAAKRRRATDSSPDQTFLSFFGEANEGASSPDSTDSGATEATGSQTADSANHQSATGTADSSPAQRRVRKRPLKKNSKAGESNQPSQVSAETASKSSPKGQAKPQSNSLQGQLFETAAPGSEGSPLDSDTKANPEPQDQSTSQSSTSRHLPAPHIRQSAESENQQQDRTSASPAIQQATTADQQPQSPASPAQDPETAANDTSNRVSEMVDMVNRHLAELGGEDFSEPALETLGKHGHVQQLVPNEVILASAGTGKTFQLSNRYLKLLALGQDPRHILATTFTRKAAGEILERIILRLTAAALSESDAEKLSEFIELPVNRDDCRVLLKRMIRFLNGLQIGTLDSFFGQVARSFCFELELPQSWQIVNEQDETRMQNRAIALAMNESKVLDLLHLLEKGEAARGLGAQMRWAVSEVYPLFNQTEVSAWQIPGAQDDVPTPKLDGLKNCLPLAQEAHGDRGRRAIEQLIDMAEAQRWDEVLKNTFAKNVRHGNFTYSRTEMPDALVFHIQMLLKHADDLFVSQLQQRNTSAYHLMEHFDRHYRDMKSVTGDLRFDNVQTRLARWVSQLEDPAARMVARLDFHIQHLMLDEFQDTVPQQWQILYPIARSIAGEASASSTDNGTLFCVGDQKQAIYRWRGGDSRIFGTVEQQFASMQRRAMNTSYRSSPIVLNAVNDVFANLKRHPKSDQWEGLVQQWETMFQPHLAADHNQRLSGHVTLEESEEDEDLMGFAAQRVAELYAESADLTIGVLVPKNQDVAVVMGHLNRLKVPASEESGNPLSDSAAIQLIISLLQLLDHPGDTASWFHLLHSEAAATLLTGFSEQDRLVAQRAFPKDKQPIWERLIAWAETTKSELMTAGLGETMARWASLLKPHVGPRDRKRLKQATAAAYQYDSPAPMRTAELGRFLQDLKQIDRTQDRVRVMNIHQSKGLEFDIVVLTGLESLMSANMAQALVSYQPDLSHDPTIVCRYTSSDHWDLLPADHRTMFQSHRREHFNEKLCQLYVGMTRARRALHMLIEPVQKDAPQSLAGVLRASLTDCDDDPENPLYQSGDPLWMQPYAAEQQKKTTDVEMPAFVDQQDLEPAQRPTLANEVSRPQVKLASGLPEARRGLQRVSPSSLEGGATFPLVSLLGSQQRQDAFLKGEVIHSWFELVDWVEDGLPDEDALRQRARKVDVRDDQWEHWIPDFFQMIQNPATRHVLTRDFYQERIPDTNAAERTFLAQNERPFAILDNGQLLNGFIDRLVTWSVGDQVVGADIVDYKTDRFDDPQDAQAIANRVAHYRPQLEAYRVAVSKLTRLPLSNISARLVFVSLDRVESI